MASTQQRIDRLKEILVQGDYESFTAFFDGMPENERLELAEAVRELYLETIAQRENFINEQIRFSHELMELIITNRVAYEENAIKLKDTHTLLPWCIRAALATLPFDELKKLELPLYDSREFEILLKRNPPWLAEYVHFLQEANKIGPYTYSELGLSLIDDLPRTEKATRLILHSTYGRPLGKREKGNLREFVLKCPRILNEEVWKFFDLPTHFLY
jgi:hypothetical protein